MILEDNKSDEDKCEGSMLTKGGKSDKPTFLTVKKNLVVFKHQIVSSGLNI